MNMKKLTNSLTALLICFTSGVLVEASSRIANGRPAAENRFPYVVSLQYGLENNATATRGHICGGVLVNSQFVLTLASCTYQIVNNVQVALNVTNFRVFAGTNLTNDTLPDRVRSIHNVTVHPDYIPYPASLNNIAVIRLQTPFPNTTANPLPLPSRDFAPVEYTSCVTMGWGGNTTVLSNAQLLYTDMYVYNYDICRLIFNVQEHVLNIFPSMICAASYDISSRSCLGDIGNPLVCNGTLTGILMVPTACSDYTTSYPEVFTRISEYSDWIHDVITDSASSFIPSIMSLAIVSVLQIILAINVFN